MSVLVSDLAPRGYVDLLGFLAPQGETPTGEFGIPGMRAMHVTVAPPKPLTCAEILKYRSAFHLNAVSRTVASPYACIDYMGLSEIPLEQTAIVYGLQAPPTDFDYEKLFSLRSNGIRIYGLAYNDHSALGAGCLVEGSLTEAGKAFIRLLGEAEGCVVDVAHANEETAFAALRFIEDESIPVGVMNSHTGCSTVYDHPRNSSDYLIKTIADMGGIIGIYTLTFGLYDHSVSGNRDKAPSSYFLDHLYRAASLVGSAKVGIGSDAVYRYMNPEEGEAQFQQMCEMLNPDPRLQVRYPDTVPIFNSALRMERIVGALAGESCNEKCITDLTGRSALRFFERYL